MPYNPAGLGIREFRLNGGPQIFNYKGADALAVIDAAGYWSNAADRGAQVGDFVLVQLSPSDDGYVHRFVSFSGIAGTTKQFGWLKPEALNVLSFVLRGLAPGLSGGLALSIPNGAVAQLPAAAAYAGSRAFVTDATVTTFASTVVGGGTNKVPVTSDGTNWIIG